MSLESEIKELTQAVRDLTARLASGTPASAPPVEAAPETPKKGKTKTVEPETKPEATIQPKPLTADDHQKLAEPVIQELLNKGKKTAILELNKKFGVERGRQLYGTEKFLDYLAECQKLNAAA